MMIRMMERGRDSWCGNRRSSSLVLRAFRWGSNGYTGGYTCSPESLVLGITCSSRLNSNSWLYGWYYMYRTVVSCYIGSGIRDSRVWMILVVPIVRGLGAGLIIAPGSPLFLHPSYWVWESWCDHAHACCTGTVEGCKRVSTLFVCQIITIVIWYTGPPGS